jgi:hypothetical protein
MRSPERKGTVPSLAMSVPSNASTMSPRFSTLPAGEVGSTRRTYTPFCPACSRGAGAHQAKLCAHCSKALSRQDKRGSAHGRPRRCSLKLNTCAALSAPSIDMQG